MADFQQLPQAERDRVRRVTGRGEYTADLQLEGTAFAAFVRSPHAHARIVRIDAAEAGAMPGVLAVITGGDAEIAALGNFPVIDRIGVGLIVPHRPVLAGDIVRHVGEAVAMVIAETAHEAADAAEAVMVDYVDLPAVIGLTAALAESAACVHAKAAGNVALHHEGGDRTRVEAVLADAAHVIETEIEMPRLTPFTLEPRAAVGRWDAASGRYVLRAPHQGVNEIRRDLASVFGVAADRFQVLQGDVGGGFGPRNIAYPEYAAVLLASRRIGRPVAWHGGRSESFLTDIQGRGVRVRGRLGLDGSGRFLALDVTYDADLGAYVSPVGAFAAVHNPLQSLTGCYAIPHAAAAFRLVFTHAVPTGPYRGAGRPEMALLIERLVDIAARRLAIDPFVLRRRNAITKVAFPYTLPSGARYDSGDFEALLDAARRVSDWDGHGARAARAAQAGKVLGHGMALFIEVSGGGGAPDEARLTLSSRGGMPSLVIETVTASTGQSHARTFANIACPRLGLFEGDSELRASDPDTALSGAGSYASRSTIAAGSAVAQAADEIAAIVLGLAALRANCAAGELRLCERRVERLDGTAVGPIVAFLEEPVCVTGKVPPSNAFASGCHVVEVEIDADTGACVLQRYVAVDDAGVVIDHQAADGQIHGGIAQGVGEVLGEEATIDPATGQMLAASLMDYAMPRAADFPQLVVEGCNTPSPFNPLGVKGIGEAGTTGALCAVTSAVFDALGGQDLPAMPFTAERVWRVLSGAPSGIPRS